MYTTYVLYNREKSKVYIGQTADIKKRLERHNKLLPSKNTSYTSRNSGVWEIIYTKEFPTRAEAIKKEKELKSSRGRSFIKSIMPL